ncbi:Cell polarity protein PAR6 [Fasciola gigantica]|uniref:Cell polarity protein PAR6 n=1 Tax=Fasciola gigantica TaxID=46835 RepID=A0A504Y8B4_FASGI|nr:Cell polarity protein PAR6 [Fasciola gigantica]
MSIGSLVEVKSKSLLERVHHLQGIEFVVQYVEPKNADLLPINNDKNYAVALAVSKPILRILLQRKGESYGELYGYKSHKSGRSHKSAASVLRSYGDIDKHKPPDKQISLQNDFHLVSSILDVDIVPRTMRRVRLVRTPNKNFGLYIRNGISEHNTVNGYESVPAFFVSRLDRDGIAYSTGLLAENDEIIEVNGIEVFGKTMDQVTDMMVANSSNLIITVRPNDQTNCLPPTNQSRGRLADRAHRPGSTSTLPTPVSDQRPSSLLQMANGQNRTLPANGLHGSSTNHIYSKEPVNRATTVSHAGTGILVHEDDEDETDEDINAGLITL